MACHARGWNRASPFGQSIAALVIYLHYAHAIGLERLAALMGEMFALTISEGAISQRCWPGRVKPLLRCGNGADPRDCDGKPGGLLGGETSARVTGKTWWEWVFVGTLAVLHVLRPQPRQDRCPGAVRNHSFSQWIWVSDMLGSQRGHGVEMAGVPGAPAARCALRRRVRRCHLQRRRSNGCCCAPSPSGGDATP